MGDTVNPRARSVVVVADDAEFLRIAEEGGRQPILEQPSGQVLTGDPAE